MHRVAEADLNLLVVLDELLRARSTTLAARRLGRTQSAVSHALARLRATFGDPLLVRVGARLQPTPAAERLQAELRDLLHRAEGLLTRSSAAFAPSALERTFTLATSDFAEMLLLPRLLPVLRREAPRVDVVTLFLGDDVERALQSREVDLGFGTRFRAVAGLVVERARHEEMAVLLRRKHPALRERLTPARYAALDHVLVAPRGLPGSAVDSSLEPLGLTRRVVLRTPHFAVAASVVAETELVVTVPVSFARRSAERYGLVVAAVPIPLPGFTFSLAFASAAEADPAHAWFRARVLESAAE